MEQVCLLGCDGAEEQQQVGNKKFQALTVRVQREVEFNMHCYLCSGMQSRDLIFNYE